MAARAPVVIALAALTTLGGACSGDDEDGDAAPTTVTAASPAAAATSGTTALGDESSPAPSTAEGAARSTPAPTLAPAETGVPGLDSEDAFCAAWSRFGGSWQLLVQAGAAGDPGHVARLEVIASTVVQDAFGDVFSAWPAELETERDVVADSYFGAFQRRSADAAAALAAAGASDADVVALVQVWNMTLEEYDPATTIAVDVPPELAPLVDQAAVTFTEQRVPLQQDPSMVITVDTPMTDAFLATACPDQGWIVGQDVVEDAA
jgi:hypothetical protein